MLAFQSFSTAIQLARKIMCSLSKGNVDGVTKREGCLSSSEGIVNGETRKGISQLLSEGNAGGLTRKELSELVRKEYKCFEIKGDV